jgi:hypothetical protein
VLDVAGGEVGFELIDDRAECGRFGHGNRLPVRFRQGRLIRLVNASNQ